MIQNKKNAFTLIELLVVMVIIGILAGIGISQFKSQQKKARDARRVSECSQFERCDMLRQSCVAGGDTVVNCTNICDTSMLSCQLFHFATPGAEVVDSGGTVETGPGWATLTSLNSNLITEKIIDTSQDGMIEWTMPQEFTSNALFVGLTDYPSLYGYYSLDYALYLQRPSRVQIIDRSADVKPETTYTTNDTFQIEKQDNVVVYKKNGEIFYTSAVPVTADLYLQMNHTTTIPFSVSNVKVSTFK